MTKELALLGGSPVRSKPYPIHTTFVDDAEEKAVLPVIREGHLSGFSARPGDRFLGGNRVRELERRVQSVFKVKHAVSFNSATSALHGAVSACGIGPGDEVITSSYTMCATASCILMQNAVPIFADVEDRTYGLDPKSVASRITDRTKAIITVNLFGHPSRLSALESLAREHGLRLIEDNAQSPGSMYRGRMAGAVGDVGILSLNYHKSIQTGEGGIALTDDDDIALRMQLVRNHGEVVAGEIGMEDLANQLGWNYRLSEIQAAIGIVQLPKLDTLNDIRRRLAAALAEGLQTFEFLKAPIVEDACTHSYYLFPMRYDERVLGVDRGIFARAMNAEGISLSTGYVKPIYLNAMYQRRLVYGRTGCPFTCGHYEGEVDYSLGLCPLAERLYFREMVTTDICKYPNTETEVEEFVSAVEKVSGSAQKLRALGDG